MDDRANLVGICCLGSIALGALVIMGLCAGMGKDIPPAVAGAFGTAVGSLATVVTPRFDGAAKR